MGEKLVIGPINKGLKTDRTPFIIDNDSFPVLINAYQWRGRVKRKRGTSLLGRLKFFLKETDYSGNVSFNIAPVPIATGIVSFVIGTDIFIDTGGTNPVTLLTNGSATVHTLDRSTGLLTINGSIALTNVYYYPSLPVMGLEELILSTLSFPGNIAFDQDYSYNLSNTIPSNIYNVSFYKNPVTNSSTLPGYLRKTTWSPLNWNGQNYQQFWTTNYQGAMWATNGVTTPFNPSNLGMQYNTITTVNNVIAGPPAFANITFTNDHGLSVGDFLFINEVSTTTGINFQTGYVTVILSDTAVTVEFPNATLDHDGTGGIAQYLTNVADNTVDCLRWYDGDPTNGVLPDPSTALGWVNFCPPISLSSYGIADLTKAQYYLVGAKLIFPFKDRLIFFGPVVQTSGGTGTVDNTSQVYLPDTIIYSQNGTPFYTCSFAYSTVNPTSSASLTFNPILTPVNQSSTASAYWADQTGFGGFQTVGVSQEINTVSANEDVLIVGFDRLQTRMVYSGNDIVPFNFFIVNSELGSSSTFSAINMDQGVISRGSRGYIITSQTGAQRVDLEIPDQVFEINLNNNGRQKVTAQRDFINEWIYFSYPSNTRTTYLFNNQTLQYNYRDDSWGVFNESYTTYGSFAVSSGITWTNIGNTYPTWGSWNTPWNSSPSTQLQPQVIAGNQQGFVLLRNTGSTEESNSLTIQNIAANVVTSPNHCLNEGDYIIISGAQGTVASSVNGLIFSVGLTTINSFTLDPVIESGTYLGGGLIQRMYVPFIQTKQFPTAWDMGRKTRIGVQQYLFTTTANGQITLLIYLSEDANTPWNATPIVPDAGSINNGIIYSTLLYTCPEGTNLGLTSANINLQLVTATTQQQIWHRMNTSLIGDTVQMGFTLSDSQMRDTTLSNQFAEVEFHAAILDLNPSQTLV